LIQSLDGRPQHVTKRIRLIGEGNPHNDIRCAYLLCLTERVAYRLPKTVLQLVAADDSIQRGWHLILLWESLVKAW